MIASWKLCRFGLKIYIQSPFWWALGEMTPKWGTQAVILKMASSQWVLPAIFDVNIAFPNCQVPRQYKSLKMRRTERESARNETLSGRRAITTVLRYSGKSGLSVRPSVWCLVWGGASASRGVALSTWPGVRACVWLVAGGVDRRLRSIAHAATTTTTTTSDRRSDRVWRETDRATHRSHFDLFRLPRRRDAAVVITGSCGSHSSSSSSKVLLTTHVGLELVYRLLPTCRLTSPLSFSLHLVNTASSSSHSLQPSK